MRSKRFPQIILLLISFSLVAACTDDDLRISTLPLIDDGDRTPDDLHKLPADVTAAEEPGNTTGGKKDVGSNDQSQDKKHDEALGCTARCQVFPAEAERCGENKTKILVCHIAGKKRFTDDHEAGDNDDSDEMGRHLITLCVAQSAIYAHLCHGDELGPCK